MNERKIYNNFIYWKNRFFSLQPGNVEDSSPNKVLMSKIRDELLSMPIIYQKIPFEHFKNFPFYRDPTERLDLIKKHEKSFRNKKMLDLGSSLGFYCFSMSKLGARECIGVDADLKSVKVCNLIKKLYGIKNIKFVRSFITPQKIKKVGKVDVTIFFSTFHHIISDKRFYPRPYGWNFKRGISFGNEILSAISSCSKNMYFEMGTSYESSSWEKSLNFMLPDPTEFIEYMLLKHFKQVQVIRKLDLTKQGQDKRPVFLCKN